MKIWSAHYTMVARSALSGKALNKIRIGSLLKIEDNGAIGYADLHPWPELGDEPLDEQLQLLAAGKPTDLARRSLRLADLDRAARSAGINVFEGATVPDSHYLVNDLASLKPDALEGIWAEGFRVMKFKFGRNTDTVAETLIQLAPALKRFSLRFDFAGLLMAGEFADFLKQLEGVVLDRVEFIEDPMPWNDSLWQALREIYEHNGGLRFALDRITDEELTGLEMRGMPSPAFQSLIVKPAAQDPLRMAKFAKMTGAKICVTTYLDHPVGQVGAALEAAKLYANEEYRDLIGICGLLSHRAFEKTAFSEALPSHGPRFAAPSGTGIGFDELLAKQPWKELS